MTDRANAGFFITGSDTDVGKSYIGADCVKQIYQQGLAVQAFKPIESGCEIIDGELFPSDGSAYFNALDKSTPLSEICPFRFEAAVAPPQAMTDTNKVYLRDITESIKLDSKAYSFVEGAGGFYSPLCADADNADLAQALGLPLILVVGNKVGCINHAVLTLEAILNKKLSIAAIVLNDCNNNAKLLEDNFESLIEALQKAKLSELSVYKVGFNKRFDINNLI